MYLNRILKITGFALLGACFALSLARVLSRTAREFNPSLKIIRMGHFIQEDGFRSALDQLAKDYTETHPNVLIEQTVVPERVYGSWIKTTIVGEQAPDLMLHTGATHEFLLREFESLNTIVEDPNPYNAGTELEDLPWRETFLDGLSGNPAYKPNLVSYYGIPVTSTTTRALFNRELLIEVTGSANEPETYDEFVALCREVRSFARTQKRTLFPIAASGTGDVLLRRLLTSQTQRTMLELDVVRPLQLVSDEVINGYLNRKWGLNDPDLRFGLELIRDVGRFTQPGFLQQTSQDALFYFSQGRALMMVANSIHYHSIRAQTPFEIGILDIPLPSPRHPRYGHYMLGRVSEGGNITDLAFGLTRQSKHQETALDFLRFLSSQGANQKFARLSGRLPAVVGVEPNSEMAGFIPVLSGYPSGYSPESAGGSARSLFRSNLYRLWDDSEGINTFLEMMNAGFEEAVLHQINFELRQKGERVSEQDVWLAGHWMQRLREPGFDRTWNRARDPIHMMLESQTMHEGDRHWHRYTMMANGHRMRE